MKNYNTYIYPVDLPDDGGGVDPIFLKMFSARNAEEAKIMANHLSEEKELRGTVVAFLA